MRDKRKLIKRTFLCNPEYCTHCIFVNPDKEDFLDAGIFKCERCLKPICQQAIVAISEDDSKVLVCEDCYRAYKDTDWEERQRWK